MFQKFVLKQAIKSQLKGMPEDQQELILKMVEKNPDFFVSLAKEADEEAKKSGTDKAAAVVTVLEKHRDELARMLGEK